MWQMECGAKVASDEAKFLAKYYWTNADAGEGLIHRRPSFRSLGAEQVCELVRCSVGPSNERRDQVATGHPGYAALGDSSHKTLILSPKTCLAVPLLVLGEGGGGGAVVNSEGCVCKLIRETVSNTYCTIC